MDLMKNFRPVDGGIWQTPRLQAPALRACEFKSHSTDTVSLKVLGSYWNWP